MRRSARLTFVTGSVLSGYVVAIWFLGRLLRLSGADLWILRGGLWLLGALAAGLILWYLLKVRRPAGAIEKEKDDLDVIFNAAKQRLSAARVAGATTLSKLPVVLILGPAGGTKTTTVLNSGLDPDLLAGEIHRGDTIAPTSAVNLWYSHKTVFLEAGGAVIQEPSRWARLIHGIRPPRLAAVLAGRAQAPRVAIVCFSAEEFFRPGSSEAVPQAARALRERLSQLSQALGIRLPVYVLFTKADRVPHFAEFVRNLSDSEAQQTLGATLRMSPPIPPGAHADREYQRVNDAFEAIFTTLAAKRLQILPRDQEVHLRAAAYEFPRELRKLAPLASQFLVELCKPTQLAVSPFLRGFYFSGVRPVVVHDTPAAVARSTPGDASRIGATQVFDQRSPQAPTPQPAAGPTSRRVPQWVFLKRLFRDVILRDRVALGVTQTGVRLNQLRRIALGSVALLAALLTLAFIVSYVGNRRLDARALRAARDAASIAAPGPNLPDVETLRRLEGLRVEVARLTQYRENRIPLRLRWGLYTGSAISPRLRELYYRRFESVLLDPTRAALQAALTGLPPTPDQIEYDETYDLLATYLKTTSHPDRLHEGSPVPVLMNAWLGGRTYPEEGQQLARQQFEFYSRSLCVDYPCESEPDIAAISSARVLLGKFGGLETQYNALVRGISAGTPTLRFNELFPRSATVIRNAVEIPGAFTEAGWDSVHARLAGGDLGVGGEGWVLGGQATAPVDPNELRDRYEREYINVWTRFLNGAQYVGFGNLSSAANALDRLSGNESPLLQLLALTAQNTGVDSVLVGSAFRSVHSITPPDVTEQVVTETSQPYLDGLLDLKSSLERARPDDDASMEDARSSAIAARNATTRLARGFTGDIGNRVEGLMQEPIRQVEGLIRRAPAANLNAVGQRFCQSFGSVVRKFPFDANASQEADIREVRDMFHPAEGALQRFYNETLTRLIERQGSQYVAISGASPPPNPAFVAFFNRATAVSDALFPDDEGPSFGFSLRVNAPETVPSVTFSFYGQPQTSTRTDVRTGSFAWTGQTGEVVLSGQVGGRPEEFFRVTGPWAIFRLFHSAQWTSSSGNRHRVEWPVSGGAVIVGDLTLSGPPILEPDFFSGLGCVSRITR